MCVLVYGYGLFLCILSFVLSVYVCFAAAWRSNKRIAANKQRGQLL